MADTKDALYFAGFFDGEGCVAVYPRKYVVSLTNTDIRPLARAQELWGGHISSQSAESRRGAVQDLLRWQIYGQHSRAFVEEIRPYVLVKGEQLDLYPAILDVIPRLRGARRADGVAALVEANGVRLRSLKRGA